MNKSKSDDVRDKSNVKITHDNVSHGTEINWINNVNVVHSIKHRVILAIARFTKRRSVRPRSYVHHHRY